MLKEMKLIPVTEQSYPFETADFHCRLSEFGYVEDEFFMSGTANVYREGEHYRPEVICSDAPYTTRELVRRPETPAKFSGNVVVEVLNASAMMDIDRMWVDSWKFFTRSGDIYVGITSKGHVVDALKRFDPERYAPINWANPMPERKAPEKLDQFGFLPQFESGLFWDMLTDLAKLLRSEEDANPLREYGKKYLYLTGWSQSGSYLCRYVNSFAYLPENRVGGPVFDGYLAAGCGADMAPMNAYEPRTPMMASNGIPKGSVMGAREPYININTESENRMVRWSDDYDRPDYKFRTYQIPASSHDSKYNLLDYYEGKGREDCRRIGMELTYDGVEGEPLDNPYELVFNAAWRNLYLWVREGMPAPHAPKIETEFTSPEEADPFGAWVRNKPDSFGNAVGGIRTPGADYPVGVYSSSSKMANGKYQAMFGQVIPFSPQKLQALYGTLEHYRKLVSGKADEMIALGFLLPEDREEMIELTVELAAKRGLK